MALLRGKSTNWSKSAWLALINETHVSAKVGAGSLAF